MPLAPASKAGSSSPPREPGTAPGSTSAGGVLVVLGPLGRLAGERQTGGRMFVPAGQLGPHAGHGRRGGACYGSTPPPTSACPPRTPRSPGRILGEGRPASAGVPPTSVRLRRVYDGLRVPRGTSERTWWQHALGSDILERLAGGAAGRGGRVPRGAGTGPVPDDARARSGPRAGRPVAGGWIEFVPVDGTVGDRRSAPLAADGRFEVSGVAVGRNVIGLINAPIRWPDGGNLFHTQGSPIRRDIRAGPRPR